MSDLSLHFRRSGDYWRCRLESSVDRRALPVFAVDFSGFEVCKQHLKDHENELELEADIKNTGKFISWVVNDIMKEEHDSIIANNINVKKLSGAIGNIARQWFIHKI